MKIWIDADACPRPVKDLVFRASRRLGLTVILVADRPLSHPPSPLITTRTVPKGMDSADLAIIESVEPGDMVITADLPLAAETVGKGARALNPRGEIYTEENVTERLSIRDFLTSLRESGIETGGPAPFSPKDLKRFADALEKTLLELK